MTVFKAAAIALVVLCILIEIVIGVYMNQIMEDVQDMKGIYKDIIHDELKTTEKCFHHWNECIQKWDDTVNKFEETSQQYHDIFGAMKEINNDLAQSIEHGQKDS